MEDEAASLRSQAHQCLAMAEFHEGEAAESLRRQAHELLARAAGLESGNRPPSRPVTKLR